jgi:hypothetical protein
MQCAKWGNRDTSMMENGIIHPPDSFGRRSSPLPVELFPIQVLGQPGRRILWTG